MGLAINNYDYSYSRLHQLRQFALDVEGNEKKLMCRDYGTIKNCGLCIYCGVDNNISITKYNELINHCDCDCDGGYISFNMFGIKEILDEKKVLWGNLDKLKEEVEELNKHTNQLGDLLKVWQDFYDDVMSEEYVLMFR